jgi:hypothetical protein
MVRTHPRPDKHFRRRGMRRAPSLEDAAALLQNKLL